MTEIKKNTNYSFIDNLRFISMFGIVMEHSTLFWNRYFTDFDDQLAQTLSIQVFKFGTIIFFILSGFLIGDKFTKYNSWEYLKRRFDNTFKPWLFWCFIMLCLTYISWYFKYVKSDNMELLIDPVSKFFENIYHITLDTSYWFIVNFMICIAVLLFFRKYLYSNLFGAILALLSIFYSINLYIQIIPTAHTTAILGFVFYLWLGFQLNIHFERFCSWVEKIKGWQILLALILSFALSCAETINLMGILPKDPFNTLRLSNILYSLISFIFLFKYCNFNFIKKLKPRDTTFGIYLTHQLLIFYLLPMIFEPLHISNDQKSTRVLVVLQIVRFLIVYPTAYLLTILISKGPKKIRWIIGQ